MYGRCDQLERKVDREGEEEGKKGTNTQTKGSEQKAKFAYFSIVVIKSEVGLYTC